MLYKKVLLQHSAMPTAIFYKWGACSANFAIVQVDQEHEELISTLPSTASCFVARGGISLTLRL